MTSDGETTHKLCDELSQQMGRLITQAQGARIALKRAGLALVTKIAQAGKPGTARKLTIPSPDFRIPSKLALHGIGALTCTLCDWARASGIEMCGYAGSIW